MKFPIGRKVIDLDQEKERRLWTDRLGPLLPLQRAYFALACARRLQMLFPISPRPVPQEFLSMIEKGLALAERVVINSPQEAMPTADKLFGLSVHLAQRDYGPISFGVAQCAAFAVASVAKDDNLASASAALDVVQSMRHGLPHQLWRSIVESVEKDFARILDQLSQPPKGKIITPDEFVQAQASFSPDENVQPLIVSAGTAFNAALIAKIGSDPNQLYALPPRAFEEMIAEIFKGFGFEVELTKPTQDGGRDVVAVKHIPTRVRCLIECKRYAANNKIDVGIVRQLLGVLHDDGGTNAILATTSFFTGPAKEFIERNQWQLEGKDFHGVLEWLRQYQADRVKSLATGPVKAAN